MRRAGGPSSSLMLDLGHIGVLTALARPLRLRAPPRRHRRLRQSAKLIERATPKFSDVSAPAEGRGHLGQDRLEHMGVVLDPELVRDRQEQGVRLGDRLVLGERVHQLVGLIGVGATEDRAGVRLDVADRVRLSPERPK